MRYMLLSTALVVSLSGCTTRPQIVIAEAGIMPAPTAFRILEGGAVPSDLETALVSKLEGSGFLVSENSRLLVQIGLSELPPRTELSVTPVTEAQWRIAPQRLKSKRTRRLVVTITDSETGEEIYRAYGTEKYRLGKSDEGENLRESVLALFP